jgi:hypothetical protein
MSTTEDQPETTTLASPDTASGTTSSTAPGAVERSSTDRFMLRLLRLPEDQTSTKAEARSAFQKSLAISTCRCLLMYIVFPFVLPAVGIARGCRADHRRRHRCPGDRLDHLQHPQVLAGQSPPAVGVHDLRHDHHLLPALPRRQGHLQRHLTVG